MEPITMDELIRQYRETYAAIPREALELDLRVTIKTIQALAEGRPVAPDQLAGLWGIPQEEVQAVLAGAAAAGRAEIDAQGNLVGGILSLNPTPHRIALDGNQLYAWCAYDAIYAPGVTGKTARIESQDPLTGETIQVILSPEGVQHVQPEGTVITIVGGGTDMRGGPGSPRCSQMLFFGSRASAHQWLEGRSDVSILTVEEAYELANEFQIEPAKRLGLV